MMKTNHFKKFLLILILGIIGLSVLGSNLTFTNVNGSKTIILATTTSTDNSGLLDYLHERMTEDIGINVDIVAVGTGAALQHARKGLVDVVIVHAKDLETQFIKDGYGIHRVDLMFNDFIIVGPSNDPANIRGLTNSTEIFHQLYKSQDKIKFVSRGDNSGTHVKELALWADAKISIESNNISWAKENTWYLESGSGMAQTLTTSFISQAYTLTDRGTWLFMRENLDLQLLVEGPSLWHNSYGAILVNPEKFETGEIKLELAKTYVQWLISPIGQKTIDDYVIEGEQAFFADFLNHLDEMSFVDKEFWGIN